MERGAHGPTPAATVDADEAFRSYEFGLVSLARLGELIGTDRQGAIEFVESRGLVVQDGPTSIEEARRDISVARSLRAR